MSRHPSYGPFTPEAFAELVSAPAGVALSAIRKVDPLWGRSTPVKGERCRFKVELRREVATYERAVIVVEAADEDEAEEIAVDEAEALGNDLIWEFDDAGDPGPIEAIDARPE